jgi:hypothetical protein
MDDPVYNSILYRGAGRRSWTRILEGPVNRTLEEVGDVMPSLDTVDPLLFAHSLILINPALKMRQLSVQP